MKGDFYKWNKENDDYCNCIEQEIKRNSKTIYFRTIRGCKTHLLQRMQELIEDEGHSASVYLVNLEQDMEKIPKKELLLELI